MQNEQGVYVRYVSFNEKLLRMVQQVMGIDEGLCASGQGPSNVQFCDRCQKMHKELNVQFYCM